MKFWFAVICCGCLSWIGSASAQGTQSFLELQRKLAEEQWKRDQEEEAQKQFADEEEGEEYYVYYYDDSPDEASITQSMKAADIQENPELERRMHRGFKQPLSKGLTKDIAPYLMEALIEDAKGHSQCLRDGEEDPIVAAYALEVQKHTKLNNQKKKTEVGDTPENTASTGKKSGGRKSYKERQEEKRREKKVEQEEADESPTSVRKSLKQRQEDKKQEKEELEKKKLLEKTDPGFLQEVDCESQICGACKATVHEFASAVHNAIDNPKVEYVYDLAENFCDTPVVRQKYKPIVRAMCDRLLNEAKGYRESFVRQFELDEQWDDVRNPVTLLQKKKKICTTVGMCSVESFDYNKGDDDRRVCPKEIASCMCSNFCSEMCDRSDKCFTCHALAEDLEESVSILARVTEGSAVDVVKDSCGHMELPGNLEAECKGMATGSTLDDMAWMLKLHAEAVARKERTKIYFSDRLCEDMKQCQKATVGKRKEVEIEAVFW